MIDVGRARARYQRALSKRDLMASILDDAYEFSLPLRPRIRNPRGKPQISRLYDETAVTSLQNFASKFLQAVVPADQAAFVLRAGREIPEEQHGRANDLLDEVSDEIHAELLQSDFRTHAGELFQDLAIGTGFLRIEAGPPGMGIRYQALAPHEVVPDIGPWGVIDCMFLPREVAAGDIVTLWDDARLPQHIADVAAKTPDSVVELVEVVQRDWTALDDETWDYCVLAKDDEKPLVVRQWKGEGSCPLIAARYSVASGEVWGRGPVMHVLPAIKSLNLLEQMVFENADLAITGMWQAEDDGVINVDNVRLHPGTIIPKAPGSSGLQPLESPARFDVSAMKADEMRAAIKRGLYDDDLGPPTGTPMSATEVLQRTTDRAERIGLAYARVLKEFLWPVVRRHAYLLRQAGRIKLPAIDGRVIQIKPTSPLARAQDNEDLLRHDRFVELIAARLGPQTVQLKVNADRYIEFMGKRLGIRPRVLNTKAEEQKLLENAKAIAQQAAAAQGAVPA